MTKGMKWWRFTIVDRGTCYLPVESVASLGWQSLATIVAAVWGVAKIVSWMAGKLVLGPALTFHAQQNAKCSDVRQF